MNQTIDISKLSVIELKALCYDRILILERTQAELKALNNQINKMEEQTNVSEVVETPVVDTPVEVAPEVTEEPVAEVAPATEEVAPVEESPVNPVE